MLKQKLDDLSRTKICEELNIARSTLNGWEKYETHNIFKYIQLCELMKIDPFDELEEYRKKHTNYRKK